MAKSVSHAYVTVAEAARYIGVTPQTIYNMITDGRLKPYRLGERVLRLRLAEVDAAMERAER